MSRVTDEEVRRIIEVTSTLDITPFITAANLIVTEKLADEGLGVPLLKEIERWLAAHFIAIRDPVAKSEKTGEASVSHYRGIEGKGLDATPYGQQVKVLDISGVMVDVGKRAAEFVAIDLDLD